MVEKPVIAPIDEQKFTLEEVPKNQEHTIFYLKQFKVSEITPDKQIIIKTKNERFQFHFEPALNKMVLVKFKSYSLNEMDVNNLFTKEVYYLDPDVEMSVDRDFQYSTEDEFPYADYLASPILMMTIRSFNNYQRN